MHSGFAYEETELLEQRKKYREKANKGDSEAKGQDTILRHRLDALQWRRQDAEAAFNREPELVEPGDVEFIAYALIVPSTDPKDLDEQEKKSAEIAMQFAMLHEQGQGADVRDVSTPELATAQGLDPWPGFDV